MLKTSHEDGGSRLGIEAGLRVLYIEDNDDDATFVETMLFESTNGQWFIDRRCRLDDGLAALRAGSVDVVLLDLGLPDSHGLQTLDRLHAAAPRVAIVVLTATETEALGREAIHHGAQDWLNKGEIDGPDLIHAILLAMDRQYERNRLAAAHSTAQHQASHDALTGLGNRRLLGHRLRRALERAQRSESAVAVFLIDMDSFKPINDAHGHMVGDGFLRTLAQRLKASSRHIDTISRYGGDEFVIVAEGLHQPADAVVIARRLVHVLAEPVVIEGTSVASTVSIGVAIHPEDGLQVDELLQAADAAMYRVKQRGGNGFEFSRQ